MEEETENETEGDLESERTSADSAVIWDAASKFLSQIGQNMSSFTQDDPP
jgi:hypothetical protein